MQLIYATTNRGKLVYMRRMLADLPVTVLGLQDIPSETDWPDVAEDGTDPLANAIIKARAYYAAIKRPLFSMDSGLYIDGIDKASQPGTHVRHVNGRRLTDDEMTTHYAAIARRMGGRVRARYHNGICLILSEDAIFTHTGADISHEAFYLTDTPHPRRTPGFPLDSLSVHMATGRYYFDRPADDELAVITKEGYERFFRDALGLEGAAPAHVDGTRRV